MRVNGLDYIFRKNLQGDITGIYNSSAELIVEYTYSDAWGAGVTVSGSQASTIGMYNSFRYRGYYYDTESGLYYLNSRYYDPVACRFINADSSLHENFRDGLNLYVYCGNNPIRYSDPTGEWFGIDDVLLGTTIVVLGGIALLSVLGVAWATSIQENFTVEFSSDFSSFATLFSKQSKKSGKEKANNVPSWVNKGLVDPGLSAQENARRMLDDKYGKGGWKKGADTEYNKIVKWITRSLNVVYVPSPIDSSGHFFYDDFGNYMYSVYSLNYDSGLYFPYELYIIINGNFWRIFE